jgi:hypothetical protein
MRVNRSFATAAILAFAVVSASAQPIVSAKSGVIANAEGDVFIDGAEVQQSATHFPEVKEGSILRTDDGRVELMLPPGFMLRMDKNGALKMIANRLIDTRVEMQAGSAVVEVDQTKPDYSVAIAMKDGVVNLSKVGVYRFDSEPARLKVFHGSATVEVNGQSVMVGTGRMLALTGGATATEKFDAEQTDALDTWSRRRAEAMAVANVSGAKYGSNGNGYPSSGNGVGNTWAYNPYYDMYTYLPMSGSMCNPYYGLCFYSPMAAYQNFYLMPMMYGSMPNVGGYHGVTTNAATTTAAPTWSRATGTAVAPTSGTIASPVRASSGSSAPAGSSGGFGGAASSGAAGAGRVGGASGGTGGHK